MMVNFCIFTFILYAVGGSASAILFEGRRRRKRRYAQSVALGKRLQREARRAYLSDAEHGEVIRFPQQMKKRRGAKAPRRRVSEAMSWRTARCA